MQTVHMKWILIVAGIKLFANDLEYSSLPIAPVY